ncbi:MAG: O-antigen ligase family protein [Cyclobacteriaceae bacterium]
MSKSKYVLVGSLLIVPLVFTPGLIDMALMGRYMGLAACLFALVLITPFQIEIPTSRKAKGVVMIYALFVLLNFCSMAWSINPEEAFFESSKLLLGFLVFVFIWQLQSDELMTWLLHVVLLVSVIYLIIVGYQLINLNDLSGESIDTITGINGHKNQLSNFLLLLLTFLAIGGVQRGYKFRLVSIFLSILVLGVILMLGTRSTLVAIVVSLFSVGILKACLSRFKWVRMGAIMTVVGVGIAVSLLLKSDLQFFDTLRASVEASAEGRIGLWQNSYEMAVEHPVLGVGAGNWKTHFPDYGLSQFLYQPTQYGFQNAQRPHNDYLWIWTETGTMGLLLFLTMLLLLFGQSIVHLKKHARNEHLVLLGGLVAFLTFSFFTFPKERIEHILLFNVLLGLLLAQASSQSDRPVNLAKMKPLVLTGLLLVLIVGFQRVSGEYHMAKAIEARQAEDYLRVKTYTEKAFSWVFQIDNYGMPVKWYQGVADVSLGNMDAAMKAFREAYEVAPYNLNVLNNLASSHEMAGNHEQAKNLYQEAIRISPHFDEAKLNLAAILFNEGKLEAALSWVNEVTYDSDRKQQYLRVIKERLGQ